MPRHSRARTQPARGAHVAMGSFKPGRDSGGRESGTARAEQPTGCSETRPTPLGNGELGGAELHVDPWRFAWRRGPSRMEKGTGVICGTESGRADRAERAKRPGARTSLRSLGC